MSSPDYGLWPLVAINTAVFVLFAFSFTRPKTARDWRSFGAFSAFVVALFGYPLTFYLLSGWLGSRFPALDRLTHNSGHLWEALMGAKGDPHLNPLHLLSYVLYRAQRAHQLATTGTYARVWHPQYAAFVLIMLGFLAQWPTILTLLMFPILVAMYVRLARREEGEALAEFGDAHAAYAAVTPAFFPSRGRGASQDKQGKDGGPGAARRRHAPIG